MSDQSREATIRLEATVKAVAEGAFEPNREKDGLTYAPENAKHIGRVQGKGVVPWKNGFSADLETYKSRSKSKVETEEKMCMLEEQLALRR